MGEGQNVLEKGQEEGRLRPVASSRPGLLSPGASCSSGPGRLAAQGTDGGLTQHPPQDKAVPGAGILLVGTETRGSYVRGRPSVAGAAPTSKHWDLLWALGRVQGAGLQMVRGTVVSRCVALGGRLSLAEPVPFSAGWAPNQQLVGTVAWCVRLPRGPGSRALFWPGLWRAGSSGGRGQGRPSVTPNPGLTSEGRQAGGWAGASPGV